MPMPIAHSVVGLAAARLTGERPHRSLWVEVIAVAVLANLPDADFVPGYLVGDPARFHHGASHTLVAALLAAGLAALLARLADGAPLRWAALVFVVYASHLAADCVAYDTAPDGLALLAPFTDRFFAVLLPAPPEVIEGIRRIRSPLALLRPSALGAMVLEALLFSPLLVAALALDALRRPAR